MTDVQINERIAEACGWRWYQGYRWKDSSGLSAFAWDIPDYCSDLNAMHEAEKVFDCPELYEGNLIKVCGGVQYMWHATARQRAEAFLKTLGKWDDQSGDTTEMVNV